MKKWIKAIKTVVEKSKTKRTQSIETKTTPKTSLSDVPKEYQDKTISELEILLGGLGKQVSQKNKQNSNRNIILIDSQQEFELSNYVENVINEQVTILNELMTREIGAVKQKYIPEQEDIRKELAYTGKA